MTIRTVWLVENTVIFTQCAGDITETDFLSFVARLKAMLETGGKKGAIVHLIQDTRWIGKPYTNLPKTIQFLGFVRKQFHGWYLVLNRPGNRLSSMMASLCSQLLGIRTRPPFNSYDELRAFMNEHYPELNLPATLPNLFSKTEIEALLSHQIEGY